MEGALLLEVRQEIEEELREDLAGLKAEEAAVLSLLEARLKRDLGLAKAGPAAETPTRSVKRSGSSRREGAAVRA
jgi:DNA topoisomerase-1